MAKARAKIFPFLWYAKEAEEAAKFYASIFPDSRVDRVTSLQSESPSGPPGSVKVVDFTLFGQRIQAIPGGVGGFGRAYFTVPNLPQANSYRVSVWDYTWFQSPGDRM